MQNCIFCEIIGKRAVAEIVFEDDQVVVIKDIYPKARIHLLILSRQHLESVAEINSENAEIVSHIFVVASQMAKKMGINKSGYKVITNVGKDGGQVIGHLHFHLVGGELIRVVV